MTRQRRRELPPDTKTFAFESDESFTLALEVADAADAIAMEMRAKRPWLAQQLGSASLSILNNSAEGYGEFSPGEKARFYRYACRSLAETAAMIIFLGKKALIAVAVEVRLRHVLSRLMSILTRRARHFQSPAASRSSRKTTRA